MTFEQLRPGDVLAFGDSTRLFLIHGPEEQRPEEVETDNLRKLRAKLTDRAERREAKRTAMRTTDADVLKKVFQEKHKQAETAGVSWGFDDDAEDPEEGGSRDDEGRPAFPLLTAMLTALPSCAWSVALPASNQTS